MGCQRNQKEPLGNAEPLWGPFLLIRGSHQILRPHPGRRVCFPNNTAVTTIATGRGCPRPFRAGSESRPAEVWQRAVKAAAGPAAQDKHQSPSCPVLPWLLMATCEESLPPPGQVREPVPLSFSPAPSMWPPLESLCPHSATITTLSARS